MFVSFSLHTQPSLFYTPVNSITAFSYSVGTKYKLIYKHIYKKKRNYAKKCEVSFKKTTTTKQKKKKN